MIRRMARAARAWLNREDITPEEPTPAEPYEMGLVILVAAVIVAAWFTGATALMGLVS